MFSSQKASGASNVSGMYATILSEGRQLSSWTKDKEESVKIFFHKLPDWYCHYITVFVYVYQSESNIRILQKITLFTLVIPACHFVDQLLPGQVMLRAAISTLAVQTYVGPLR